MTKPLLLFGLLLVASSALAQDTVETERANAIREALLARVKLQDEYRKQITAAAAAWELNKLDPQSPNFERDYRNVISTYGTALTDPGVRDVASSVYKRYEDYTKAQTPEILQNPQASAVFSDVFQKTGSAELASNHAKAVVDYTDRAVKVVSSPYLIQEQKDALIDPKTGLATLDQQALNLAELKIKTAEAMQEKLKTDTQVLTDMRTLLRDSGLPAPSEGKRYEDMTSGEKMYHDIQYNIERAAQNTNESMQDTLQHLKDVSFSIAKGLPPEAAPAASPVGVKIPLTELPPEIQRKYGYDTQPAASASDPKVGRTGFPSSATGHKSGEQAEQRQLHVDSHGKTIDYIADGFTINIPAGWQVIPQSEVARKVQNIHDEARAANIPDAKIPDFRYGYQLSSDRWFSYPYVLVAINRAGRMPEDELRKHPTVDLAGISNDVRSALRRKVSNFQFGRVVYDPATQIIWMAAEVEYPDTGKVDTLCGTLLTENGYIMVYGYALPNSFDQYEPTFIQIAESIHPSDALRYKPNASTDVVQRNVAAGINWRRILIAAIIGALLAGLGATKARKASAARQ